VIALPSTTAHCCTLVGGASSALVHPASMLRILPTCITRHDWHGSSHLRVCEGAPTSWRSATALHAAAAVLTARHSAPKWRSGGAAPRGIWVVGKCPTQNGRGGQSVAGLRCCRSCLPRQHAVGSLSTACLAVRFAGITSGPACCVCVLRRGLQQCTGGGACRTCPSSSAVLPA
jgi:hypothetical protein